MKDINFVFGLGTGRCGTVSLYKLLDAQKEASFSHEAPPWLPWVLDKTKIRNKIDFLIERANETGANTVGDVALFNLKSVNEILRLLPGAKFVALKRDKEATLDSFIRKWKPKYNRMKDKRTEWDYVFPYYNLSIKEAVDKYYDYYYAKVLELEDKFPLNFRCYDTEALNSVKGVKAILGFCGIDEETMIINTGIRENGGTKQ